MTPDENNLQFVFEVFGDYLDRRIDNVAYSTDELKEYTHDFFYELQTLVAGTNIITEADIMSECETLIEWIDFNRNEN